MEFKLRALFFNGLSIFTKPIWPEMVFHNKSKDTFYFKSVAQVFSGSYSD